MATRSIKGRSFVVTGTLSKISREEAEQALRDNGGSVTADVSGRTHVLVAGDKPGSKVAKAKKLSIEVWDEAALLAALSDMGTRPARAGHDISDPRPDRAPGTRDWNLAGQHS